VGITDEDPIAWGSYGACYGVGDGEFYQPEGLAIGADGNLYVSDLSNERIQVFGAAGTFLRKWSVPENCWDIAADDSGHIYAASSTENRIVKYDAYGTELTRWGTQGSGPGEFSYPRAIAFHPQTNEVFVMDANNDRVQIFTADGLYVDDWDVNSVNGVAIDGDGHIYITSHYREPFVRIYLRTGEEIAAWGQAGTNPGEFMAPAGIAVDGQGNVYISERINRRVQKFTVNGTFICAWGELGSKDGEFYWPSGIAVTDEGNVYVSDSYLNHRVQQFDTDGRFIAKIGKPEAPDDTFLMPSNLCVDGDGYVYVVDDQHVKKFDRHGNFIDKWGGLGKDDGEFFNPEGIAVHGNSIYVVERSNARVQQFDSDGKFITMWGQFGTEDGEFTAPRGIAVDRSGNVYVSDRADNRIQKFSASGAFLRGFHINADAYAFAIDDEGYLYVTDRFYSHTVTKYDPLFNEVARWGSEGDGPGQFNQPAGVAVAPNGHVYVADHGNSRVQEFDSNGNYIEAYDLIGTVVGDLRGPSDVSFWSKYMIIADTFNYRIVRVPICKFGDCMLD
jgi:tripartite motif-containing protein 71